MKPDLPVLHLHLKREYFEQIKYGEKTEEFRLDNNHWRKRLVDREYSGIYLKLGYPKKTDTHLSLFRPWRGYSIKTITHKHFGPEPVTVFAIKVN